MTTQTQTVADRKAEWQETKQAYGASSPWTLMAYQEYQAALAALRNLGVQP
jgi:hypothetical protein